ncbi:MAG TPA: hypothetical protein VG326_12790 [Tepidisphaeraceae bacterium]|jgi:hypothetical protein|nr:hypothetical protein [Tepidisphaeraceae bacterium]
MAIPPKGDPQRPLHLAIRSTRLLGIILVSFGLLALAPILMMARRRLGGVMISFLSIYFLAAIVYLVPGAAYLVIAYFLKRRRYWAIVTGLILASIQLVLALCVAASFVVMWLGQGLGQGLSPPAYIGGAVVALIILALTQLIYHLIKSFGSIKHVSIEEQRGFEPLIVSPAEQPQL